jgi:hypothetical protein
MALRTDFFTIDSVNHQLRHGKAKDTRAPAAFEHRIQLG